MKRVRTKYQEFWFVEKVFCPGCGKKGLWTRDEDVADDAKPYFCTDCKSQFGIIIKGPIGFIHPLNQEIFKECQQAEKHKQKNVKINSPLERMEV